MHSPVTIQIHPRINSEILQDNPTNILVIIKLAHLKNHQYRKLCMIENKLNIIYTSNQHKTSLGCQL